MTRVKLIVTVDGAHGPTARLLNCLRDCGYTVDEPQPVPAASRNGGRRVSVDVWAPHGEVDARPHYVGKVARR